MKPKIKKVLLITSSVILMVLSFIFHNMIIFLLGIVIVFFALSITKDTAYTSKNHFEDLFKIMFVLPLLIAIYIIIFKEKNIWFSDIHIDNWISLYGSILTYFGTATLGLVTLRQNDRLQSENKKLVQFQMEEYTPFLQIISFHETVPDPNRVPDTTCSILFGQVEYMSKQAVDELERKAIDQLHHNVTTPKEVAQSIKNQVDLVRDIKNQQRIVIEKHGEIYWILKRGCNKPITETILPELLEKKTFAFIFQNNTKAKIKKVIFRKVVINNADQYWKFVPDKLHDYLNEILLPQKSINFNINLYWTKDEKLTELFELSQTDITFFIRLVTIGNISQDEEIKVTIWMGESFEISYSLDEEISQ